VFQEEPGKLNSTTPAWTPRLQIIDPNRPGSAPPDRTSTDRMTRSQSLTNRPNEAPGLW
jgi:hypothetical protein